MQEQRGNGSTRIFKEIRHQEEDRTPATFGMEDRSPFLDHDTFEFAFEISSDMKPRRCSRDVASRYLSRAVLERRDEMGPSFPVNAWYQWSGRRGEFDRQSFNEYCMRLWREVFFSGEKPQMRSSSESRGEGRLVAWQLKGDRK